MFDVGSAVAFLDLDTSRFKSALSSANDGMTKFKDNSNSVKDRMGCLSTAMTTLGGTLTKTVTLPLLALGSAVTVAAAGFDKSMRKISTLDLKAPQEVLDGMQKDFMDFSEVSGVAANDLALAAYDMGSALGSIGDKTSKFTIVAAKAAVGGFATTSDAVNGLSTVMNTYGLTTVEQMQEVSDQMLVAQNVGKTTFGEMAISVGNVIPLFKTAGGSTKELFSAYAILTKNGIKTAEATTGLKAIMSALIKPTSEASREAKKLGIEFSSAHMQQVGFAAFMQEINVATGGNLDSMGKLFGSVEALNSALLLSSDTGLTQYAEAMRMMDGSAGATEAAYNRMNSGVAANSQKTIESLKTTAIKFGQVLLPMLDPIIKKVNTAIEWFSNLDDGVKKTIVTSALVAASAGPVLMVVGKLVGGVSSLVTAISKVGPLLKSAFISNPALLAISAIAVGIIGITSAMANAKAEAQEMREALISQVSSFKNFSTSLSGMSTEVVLSSQNVDVVATTTNKIKDKTSKIESKINTILSSAFEQRRGLRDGEIKKITQYTLDLIKLQEQQLAAYELTQKAQVSRVELGGSSPEELTKNLAAAKKAQRDTLEQEDAFYTSRLAYVEQFHQVQGTVGSQQYKDDLEAAKKYHEEQLAGISSYYTQAEQAALSKLLPYGKQVATVFEGVNADAEKYRQLADAMTGKSLAEILGDPASLNKLMDALTQGMSSEEIKASMENPAKFLQDSLDKLSPDKWKENFIKSFEGADFSSANMLLTLAEDLKDSGTTLTPEVQGVVNSLLAPFDNLPADMQEDGKAILTNLVAGLSFEDPALQDTAKASITDILSAIRGELGVDENGNGLTNGEMETAGKSVMSMIGAGLTTGGTAANLIASTAGAGIMSNILSGMKGQEGTITTYLSGLLSKLAASALLSLLGKSGSGKGTGHAYGLSYVPYDGYPAVLHEGEEVRTRSQRQQDYKRDNSSGNSFIINSPRALDPLEAKQRFESFGRQMSEQLVL